MKKMITQSDVSKSSEQQRRKYWITSCLAHLTHDGYTDMLYIFFPIWQTQFALTLSEVGFLKTLFSGVMALLQVPSIEIANRFGEFKVLLVGTVLTSLAVLLIGSTTSSIVLGLLLIIGGLGSSVQHPLSSSLISNAYEDKSIRRKALSSYNVAGDLGKLIFPALASYFIARYDWQISIKFLAICGFIMTVALYFISTSITSFAKSSVRSSKSNHILLGWIGFESFWSLSAIGIIDSATRMGFLTFLPFMLRNQGANIVTVGFVLSLVFAGGATGKFFCGIFASRLGVLRTVIATETLTACCICAIIFLPPQGILILSPILGIALNGTSSVLYGSVPELVSEDSRNQAFAIFYTATIGSGAIAPSLYGLVGDSIGIKWTVVVMIIVVLLTIPLTIPLRNKITH